MTYDQLMALTPGTYLRFKDSDVVILVLGVRRGSIRYRYVAFGDNRDRTWGVDLNGDPDCYILSELEKELL